MKKIVKNILVCGAVGLFGATALASCFKATQSYADKIDKAAETEEYITYDEAKKSLGNECIDLTETFIRQINIMGELVALKTQNGYLFAVKGCKTVEDIQKRLDDGKEVMGIVITVNDGKCTDAEYRVIKAEDLKRRR